MGHKKKRPAAKLCVYCRQRPGSTADHVPPQNLYPAPLPQNLVTVPCCGPCNQAKRMDDDYLREYLVIEAAGQGHPIAEAIFQGPLLRASVDPYYKRTPLLHVARWSGLLAPRYAADGQYLGDFVRIPLQAARIQRIFVRLTHALYYAARHDYLPAEYGVGVRYVPPTEALAQVEQLRHIGMQSLYFAGAGEVFGCLYGFGAGADHQAKSIWLLEFYQSVHYVTFTAPLAAFPEHPPGAE